MALTVTSIHLRSAQEQIVEKRKHHFDIEESGISMGISRGSSRSGSRRSSRSQLSFGGISNLSDVEEDEEQKIRNYHHRRGPRPSIDAGGFLMPLPCSRPQSRRSSLTTGATQKKRSPPQKSYSVADITEQKRGRPFISQRTDSKGSLFSNKTEDSICSAKRPIIRAYSPDNQQIILSSPHSPKTFGNAAASSSRSPQTKKNIMLSTNDHISIDSLSMTPRLSIIAEKAVEISDQEESV